MSILDLIQKQGITPKRVSSNNGGEYASPCPKCGGEDRFRIWPGQGEHGSFWCRQCDIGGDAVSFLRVVEGRSCPEAHSDLGLECSSSTCPVLDKCSKGKGSSWSSLDRYRETPKIRRGGPEWVPAEGVAPEALWRQQAQRLVEWAHQGLLDNREGLAYLEGRGLDRSAVEVFKLGLVPDDPRVNFRHRHTWGLPEEISDQTGKPKKLWIPPGILIPYFDEKGVHRIRIRRWEGEPRYYWMPGSGNEVILLNPEARAFVVVESDLDALLVLRQAWDMVGAVPVGTSSAKPKREAVAGLRDSLSILVSLDADEAGAKASRWWLKTFPQAERWPVPCGKDPGDYLKDHGGNVRQWIKEGLPPGLRRSPGAPS